MSENIECPDCNGSGRTRWRWSNPSFLNNPSVTDYRPCFTCLGKGHVQSSEFKEKEDSES